MITVFFGFVLDPNRAVKMLGIGLSSAVFLDAFVLRTILVPSLMHMFGKANWYFPKALERITPHISVDAEDAALARQAGRPSRPGEHDDVYTRV
jgi:RND superfamily putative drug exporter